MDRNELPLLLKGKLVELVDVAGKFRVVEEDIGGPYKLEVVEFQETGRGYGAAPPKAVPRSAIKQVLDI